MLASVVVPVIIAVIGAGGGIVVALISRQPQPLVKAPPAQADPQDPPPEPPPPEPVGLAALMSGLAFMCASIVVGLALAIGKPPTDPLMVILGIAGGLFAAMACPLAYRAVRQSEPAGYEIILAASCAFIAILIAG